MRLAGNGATDNGYGYLSSASSYAMGRQGLSFVAAPGPIPLSNGDARVHGFTSAASDHKQYLNGTLVATATQAAILGARTNVARQTLGGIGSGAGLDYSIGNYAFKGMIAEILIYDRVLSGKELSSASKYLTGKYKI